MSRDEDIEIVARAIYYAAPQELLGGTVHWRQLPGLFKHLHRRALAQAEAAYDAHLTALEASGRAVVQGWQPIESAPKDRLILVYCPAYEEGLGEIVCPCQWHEDAGFCVDELRSPTHWMELQPLPSPPMKGQKG